jgi:hypothetical protein
MEFGAPVGAQVGSFQRIYGDVYFGKSGGAAVF